MTNPFTTHRMLLAPLAALALLAGCASPSRVSEPAPAPVQAATTRAVVPAPAAAPPAATAGATRAAPQSSVSTVDLAARSGAASPAAAGAAGAAAPAAAAGVAALAAPAERVVYFDFDSFAIRDDFKALIEGHARVLARDGARRMTIEGHTDERGGREYNLALGQKRAEAVVRSLVLLGVAERQLEAVSFGKERPAAQGSDESAWARNRRAELKDR
ncbi:MAG: peptidoglycan-associated lipoprotein Pal [Betaproteobacteria bacterium]